MRNFHFLHKIYSCISCEVSNLMCATHRMRNSKVARPHTYTWIKYIKSYTSNKLWLDSLKLKTRFAVKLETVYGTGCNQEAVSCVMVGLSFTSSLLVSIHERSYVFFSCLFIAFRLRLQYTFSMNSRRTCVRTDDNQVNSTTKLCEPLFFASHLMHVSSIYHRMKNGK